MPTPETRSFELREGTSDKFWSITLDGPMHTVRYGRRGTAGQEKAKSFGSAAEARAAYEKLIAEKVGKGYQEKGAAPAAVPKDEPAPHAPVPVRKQAPARQPKVIESTGLHLAPEDWLFATWRPRVVRERPKAPAFSLEDGLKRFSRFIDKSGYRGWTWEDAKLPPAMSPEEARFWIEAMASVTEPNFTWSIQLSVVKKELLAKAARADVDHTPAIEAVAKRFGEISPVQDVPTALLLPLEQLYSTEELDWFLRELDRQQKVRKDPGFRRLYPYREDDVIRVETLPYLAEEKLAVLRRVVMDVVDPAQPIGHRDLCGVIAPLLGVHDLMLAFCQGPLQIPLSYAFGLGSADLLVEHYEKRHHPHGFSVREPRDQRAWLAHTELKHLRHITDDLVGWNRSMGAGFVKAFGGLVSAPEAAPEFLRLVESGSFVVEGRAWFASHPESTIAGLAGNTSDLARSLVLSARRQLGEAIEEAASIIPEIGKLPQDLADAFATARAESKPKSPKWITSAELPPIVIGNERLNRVDTDFILAILATAPPRPLHPLLAALRQQATTESLDTFAEALFTKWREAGLASKERWALLAMGAIGSDRCALRLAPFVREWPGESKHQAATWGLECLRLIGTDTAIMQINYIAQKAKFQAIKKNAQETIEAIAEDRGLTREELEDRIVPDSGLDARGGRTFDFGPRQFQLRIGNSLKPIVIDAEGNRRDDLPKPTAKDDPALSQAAVSEWKLLKKQVTEVVKGQVARLEQALVTQRRWAPADFDALMVHHPILGTLIRPLVWGVFDAANQIVATFRVTEDFGYADSDDNTFTVPAEAKIGVLHPAHIDDGAKARWGELLADYELIQPFPQLARNVRRLTSKELEENEIVRHTEAGLEPIVFAGICKRIGYTHGEVGDGGSYFNHVKWFSTAGLTVVLQHTWMSIGYYETDPVCIEKVYFIRERFGKVGWEQESRDKVPLKEVDEVVISEVLGDIAVLAARAVEVAA